MKDLRRLLQAAENVSRLAGDRLAQGAGDYRSVNSDKAKDVKLQADVESEKLIREHLSKEADFPIIGEEKGGDAGLADGDELYWVVDPLDGTYNYLRDLPMACVSVGLFRGEEPVLGVIYDFNRDEMFSGIAGEGLMLNGASCTPQWAETLGQATLATGFPAGMDFSGEALQEYIGRVQQFKKIRLLGSAALAVAYVAVGRVDVYYEESINLWDVAAGLALVKAAGGSVRMTRNKIRPLAYDVWASGREEFI